MKQLLITLLMLIPFGLSAELPLIEPELYSEQNFKHIGERVFTEHNGLVYIYADDGEHGEELWVFDGTLNGMRMLKDINPKTSSKPLIVSAHLNNHLLFIAEDSSEYNGEREPLWNGLWATDGTEEGTSKIFSGFLSRVTTERGNRIDSTTNFFKFKNKIFFFVDIHEERLTVELWCTDGTKNGTNFVKRFKNTFPEDITVLNDRFIFFNNHNSNYVEEWSSDGTSENTKIFLTTNKINHDIYIESMRISNDRFIFYTYSGLWVTDGTSSGSFKLDSLIEGLYNPIPFLIQSDKMHFFFTFSQDSILSFWRTDGTIDGTIMLVNLTAIGEDAIRKTWSYNDMGGYYYFSTESKKTNIKSLWCTDGTKKGTKIIYTGKDDENVAMSFVMDDKLYFSVNENNSTVYDTYSIKGFDNNSLQLFKDFRVSFPFANDDERFLFTKFDDYTIWVSDGTEIGSKELNNEINNESYSPFANNFDNLIYFHNFDLDNNKYKTFKTNFTTEGTYLIKPSNILKFNSVPHNQILHNLNNHIYFFADYYGKGQQLYRIPNTTTSIEESKQSELMTVYPNPANEYIQLELNKPMQLSIVNSTGAKVKDYGIVADGKLNVAALYPGVYFVVDEQGNNIAKFVKE